MQTESMRKKALFIVNPKAGKIRIKNFLFDVIGTFAKSDIQTTVEMTKYSGHAAELTSEYGKDFDFIFCAGGDGTLNETIQGCLDSGLRIPIGYIPCGSTNDFATTLKISKNIKKAAEDIAKDHRISIDVGRFGNRYFSYVASFGAFTKSSYSTPQNAKNALGHFAYLLSGIQELGNIRSEHMIITKDDGTVIEGNYIFGAISNTTSVGGIISLKDKWVTLNDGKFEIILVKNPKNIVELNITVSSILSQSYDCEGIVFENLKSVDIKMDNPLIWTLDGEKAETDGEVHIENIHNGITLLLPEEADSSAILNE